MFRTFCVMVYSVAVGLFASILDEFKMKSFIEKMSVRFIKFALLASAFIVISGIVYLFAIATIVALGVFK